MVGGEEVAGQFVVSGGDTAPILDLAEEVLNLVPTAIDGFGAIRLLDCVATARDGWHGTVVGNLLAHFLTVIGLVGGDEQRCPGCLDDFRDNLAVMDMPAGENEVQRTALAVDTGVDFRAAPTAADADRLIFLPPFAPLAARCALTILLSIKCRELCDFSANGAAFVISRRAIARSTRFAAA